MSDEQTVLFFNALFCFRRSDILLFIIRILQLLTSSGNFFREVELFACVDCWQIKIMKMMMRKVWPALRNPTLVLSNTSQSNFLCLRLNFKITQFSLICHRYCRMSTCLFDHDWFQLFFFPFSLNGKTQAHNASNRLRVLYNKWILF